MYMGSATVYKDLVGPEKVVVDRLVQGEPLEVVNAWLVFSGYNPVSVDGLKNLQSKFHDVIIGERAKLGSDEVLVELRTLKDRLVNMTERELDPKDLAYVSNSLNALSKTISDYVDKNKMSIDDQTISENEFIGVLDFLVGENVLQYVGGGRDELRKRLSETLQEK
jgi:hypothetical protein